MQMAYHRLWDRRIACSQYLSIVMELHPTHVELNLHVQVCTVEWVAERDMWNKRGHSYYTKVQ